MLKFKKFSSACNASSVLPLSAVTAQAGLLRGGRRRYEFLTVAFIAAFFIFGEITLAAESLDLSIIEIGAYKPNGYEYIKIFNNTSADINLDGWKFVEGFSDSKPEGIKHGLNEVGGGFAIGAGQEAIICQDPNKFFEENNFSGLIIDSSWSSLNESGERLQLLDGEGNVIEDFIYPPAPDAPLKRINYTLLDYSSDNWTEEILINQESEEQIHPNPPLLKEGVAGSGSTSIKNEKPQIIINEIFPNPLGADNEKEFIELKNIGDTTINLKDWEITDNSTRVYRISDPSYNRMFIRPGQFFVIYREKSKIALNNSSDLVKLYNIEGSLIDEAAYSGCEEEKSYSKGDGFWNWSPPTPGEKNNVPRLNDGPIIKIDFEKIDKKILFDASDSFDPDGDEMFFNWDFGDGGSSTLCNPVYEYSSPGEYEVKLTIFDSLSASAEETTKINIGGETPVAGDYPKLELSELFPNPAGRDDMEFIEIFNPGNEIVNLKNWTLKDKSLRDGYKIKKESLLEPKEYIVLYKEETGITLNNTSETVYLLNPGGEISAEASYEKAEEEMSYNLLGNKWGWSYGITPWEANEKDFNDFMLPLSEENFLPKLDPNQAKNFAPGEEVEITGTVIVEPGILGKQIFYLDGIQIYMHSQKFPELKVGDQITVRGEISTANGEARVKIKNTDDIQFLGVSEEPIIKEIYIEDITENLCGNLIRIRGEITEKKNDTLWLDDDTEEIKVYINKYTGITLADFSTGQAVDIVGILSATESGLRLLPRYLEDMQIVAVLGEKAYAAEENYANNLAADNPFNKYLLVSLLAIIVIGASIIWKNKRKENMMG